MKIFISLTSLPIKQLTNMSDSQRDCQSRRCDLRTCLNWRIPRISTPVCLWICWHFNCFSIGIWLRGRNQIWTQLNSKWCFLCEWNQWSTYTRPSFKSLPQRNHMQSQSKCLLSLPLLPKTRILINQNIILKTNSDLKGRPTILKHE